MRRLAVGLILTVLASCGGGPLPSVSKSDCVQADVAGVIAVSADRLKFSAPCMIAPADTAFTIHFTNHQATPHDVAIYDDASKVNEQFRGDTITGPEATIDYSIEALPAGEYHFECIVHPGDMRGTLFVESAP